MALVLLTAFIAVPVIEIALFIEIGGWIGLWPTIGVVIMTAFAGTSHDASLIYVGRRTRFCICGVPYLLRRFAARCPGGEPIGLPRSLRKPFEHTGCFPPQAHALCSSYSLRPQASPLLSRLRC